MKDSFIKLLGSKGLKYRLKEIKDMIVMFYLRS